MLKSPRLRLQNDSVHHRAPSTQLHHVHAAVDVYDIDVEKLAG